MISVAYLQLRQILGSKRIFFLLFFLALPVTLAIILRSAGALETMAKGQDRGLEFFATWFLFLFFPMTCSILLSLLYGSSLLSWDLENKTLTYLFTRPLAKWKILATKYAATVGALIPPTLAAMVVCSRLIWDGMPVENLWWLGVATGGALAGYCALFFLVGTLFPHRALVISLIYAIIMEGFISFVPAFVHRLTISYYLRSIVLTPYREDVPEALRRVMGDSTALESLGMLGLIVLATLGVATAIASLREYAVTDQA